MEGLVGPPDAALGPRPESLHGPLEVFVEHRVPGLEDLPVAEREVGLVPIMPARDEGPGDAPGEGGESALPHRDAAGAQRAGQQVAADGVRGLRLDPLAAGIERLQAGRRVTEGLGDEDRAATHGPGAHLREGSGIGRHREVGEMAQPPRGPVEGPARGRSGQGQADGPVDVAARGVEPLVRLEHGADAVAVGLERGGQAHGIRDGSLPAAQRGLHGDLEAGVHRDHGLAGPRHIAVGHEHGDAVELRAVVLEGLHGLGVFGAGARQAVDASRELGPEVEHAEIGLLASQEGHGRDLDEHRIVDGELPQLALAGGQGRVGQVQAGRVVGGAQDVARALQDPAQGLQALDHLPGAGLVAGPLRRRQLGLVEGLHDLLGIRRGWIQALDLVLDVEHLGLEDGETQVAQRILLVEHHGLDLVVGDHGRGPQGRLELDEVLVVARDALQGPVQVDLPLLEPGVHHLQDVVILAVRASEGLLSGLGDQVGLEALVGEPHVLAVLAGLAQELGDGDDAVAPHPLDEVRVLVLQPPARVVEHLEIIVARLRDEGHLGRAVEVVLALGLLELAVVGGGVLLVDPVGQPVLVPELIAVLGADLGEGLGLRRLVDGRARHQGLALGAAQELLLQASRRGLVDPAELLLEQPVGALHVARPPGVIGAVLAQAVEDGLHARRFLGRVVAAAQRQIERAPERGQALLVAQIGLEDVSLRVHAPLAHLRECCGRIDLGIASRAAGCRRTRRPGQARKNRNGQGAVEECHGDSERDRLSREGFHDARP